MLSNKYMQTVSTPQDFTLYIIPEQNDTENYSIFKYIKSFLQFNTFASGYRL